MAFPLIFCDLFKLLRTVSSQREMLYINIYQVKVITVLIYQVNRFVTVNVQLTAIIHDIIQLHVLLFMSSVDD